MEKIQIVTVSDDNYAPHMGIMLTSLFKNTESSEIIKVNIIDGGISKENRDKLKELISMYKSEIEFIKIDDSLFNSYSVRNMSRVAYYKISIPKMLSTFTKKAIFLDCDLIVKDDIRKLWDIDITGYYLAAVEDPTFTRYEELGLENGTSTFNSGVMILNLEDWEKSNIEGRILAFLDKNSDKITLHDQDALNAIIAKLNWLKIHPKWNQMYLFHKMKFDNKDYSEAIHNPSIIHFNGPSKPWHYISNCPCKNEYIKYKYMSIWKTYEESSENKIKELLKRETIVLFGASTVGKDIYEGLMEKSVNVKYFVDNNSKKWGSQFYDVRIENPNKLNLENKSELLIIISSMYYDEISGQLTKMGFIEGEHFIGTKR